MSSSTHSSYAGLGVLLVKMSLKFNAIFTKIGAMLWPLLKSLFGFKSAGIVGSLGLYTYLFTWQMGLSLFALIAIHEYGHLHAMKQCGLKVKGMYFIPGFGAVALANEKSFGSAIKETYIAIMGPVWGLIGFVFPMLAVYWYTNDPLWAAIASFTAFVNLINLLPVYPLDGGRIFKGLAYSKRHSTSLIIMVFVSLLALILGIKSGFYLLVFITVIGFCDLLQEFGIKKYLVKLVITIVRSLIALVLYLLTEDLVLHNHDLGEIILRGTLIAICIAVAGFDAYKNTGDRGWYLFNYPIQIIVDVWEGIKEIVTLRTHHIQPIENYPHMAWGYKILYGFVFAAIITLHTGIILGLAKINGAEFVKDFLQ